MKSKYSTLFVLGALFVCAKFFYKYANVAQLLWLVKPVAIWISSVTNTEMYWVDSLGYIFPKLGICIEKSCSGYNMLLISYSMLSYLILLNKLNSSNFLVWIIAFLLSYFLSIFSNFTRIYFSLVFSRKLPHLWIPSHEIIHQGIGVFTNLLFLIFTYLFIQYLFKIKQANEKSS